MQRAFGLSAGIHSYTRIFQPAVSIKYSDDGLTVVAPIVVIFSQRPAWVDNDTTNVIKSVIGLIFIFFPYGFLLNLAHTTLFFDKLVSLDNLLGFFFGDCHHFLWQAFSD